jgi:cytoskeletal protein CcmA (bactofilin family)
MFSAKNESADSREAMTLIGEEAYFHGLINAKGSLRIEGTVEGNISDAVAVEIGKKGRVKGNIAAETLSVAGVVEGDVVASRAIELLAQSRMTGNIRAPKLRIEDGAVFEGQCRMGESESERGAPNGVHSVGKAGARS